MTSEFQALEWMPPFAAAGTRPSMKLVPRMKSTGRIPKATFRTMAEMVTPVPLFGSSRAISQRELTDSRINAIRRVSAGGCSGSNFSVIPRSVMLGLGAGSESSGE